MGIIASLRKNEFEFHLVKQGEECLFDYRTRRSFVKKLITAIHAQDDPEEYCNRVVLQILDYHKYKMQEYKGHCQVETFHNCLYVGTKLCVAMDLQNTGTVCMLLRAIIECELTFSRMLNSMMVPRGDHNNNSVIKRWRKDIDPEEADFSAVQYFLHHSTKGKQMYPTLNEQLDGEEKEWVRFADVRTSDGVPIYAATKCQHSDAVMLLLQYGADVSYSKFPDGAYPSILTLIKILSMQSAERPNSNSPGSSENTDQNPEEPSPMPLANGDDEQQWHEMSYEQDQEERKRESVRAQLCLNYLLRAVPRIKLDLLELTVENRSYMLNDHYNRQVVIPKMIEENIIPVNRYQDPTELKHLCRCEIRTCLYNNWQLPDGIQKLPLATFLKNYLNLHID